MAKETILPCYHLSSWKGEKQRSRHSRHFLSKTTTQFLARKDIVNRAPYDHNRHYYQWWCLKNLGRDVGDKSDHLIWSRRKSLWHIFCTLVHQTELESTANRESQTIVRLSRLLTFRNRNLSPSFIPGRGRRPRVIIKKEMIKRDIVRLSCDASRAAVYNCVGERKKEQRQSPSIFRTHQSSDETGKSLAIVGIWHCCI